MRPILISLFLLGLLVFLLSRLPDLIVLLSRSSRHRHFEHWSGGGHGAPGGSSGGVGGGFSGGFGGFGGGLSGGGGASRGW